MEELEKIEIALAKEDVRFLLKELIDPTDLHAANKVPPNTPATETDENYPSLTPSNSALSASICCLTFQLRPSRNFLTLR